MTFEELEFICRPPAFRADRQRKLAGSVSVEDLLEAQSLWRFVLGKQHTRSLRVLDCGVEVRGRRNFGFRRAAGLLRGFASDTPPTLHALSGSFGEVRLGAASDHRDNRSSSKFNSFFERPLEAVEFEDGKEERDLPLLRRIRLNNLVSLKLDR